MNVRRLVGRSGGDSDEEVDGKSEAKSEEVTPE